MDRGRFGSDPRWVHHRDSLPYGDDEDNDNDGDDDDDSDNDDGHEDDEDDDGDDDDNDDNDQSDLRSGSPSESQASPFSSRLRGLVELRCDPARRPPP